jgi:hypothetical protein
MTLPEREGARCRVCGHRLRKVIPLYGVPPVEGWMYCDVCEAPRKPRGKPDSEEGNNAVR